MAIQIIQNKFFRHRGINDLSLVKRIEDDHLNLCQNFDYIPAAQDEVHLEMRGGTSKNTMSTNLTGGTSIKGIEAANFTGGEEIIFSYKDKLYKLSSTPQILASGVTDVMHDFAMLEDRLTIWNGTDDPLEKAYNGLPSVLGGSPPKGKYSHTWHNYIWVAGMSANKNRLQGCALSDKDTWPAGNIHDRQYGAITGIGSLGNSFYIFYLKHIEVLTGFSTEDFQFNKFADIGCISHYGIVSNGSTLFFPSQNGFWAIGALGSTAKIVGGTSLIKIGSERIKNFWESLDNSTRDVIHGVHDPENHRIVWSVRRTGVSYNDREIFFDYHENILGFGINTGRYSSCYCLGNNSTNGRYKVIYGDSRSGTSGGMIYQHDPNATTDDGITITGTLTTKSYDFNEPDVDKKFIDLSILAKGTASNTSCQVYYGIGDFPDFSKIKNFETPNLPLVGTARVGEAVLQSDTYKNYSIALRKIGKALTVKIISGENTKKINIAGWVIDSQLLSRKIKTNI